jgi:2-desacetyl-2-hydroxyethyl bacteriochlorophyllide A dehydrogenase
MKALVYTAPRKLEWQDWPDPRPGPGEALVRVRAAAVCGSDVHGWLGHSRGRKPPLILGHEIAGEVVALPEPQQGLSPGARVVVYPFSGCEQCTYCNSGRDYLCARRQLLGMHVPGGFAEFLRVSAKNLYPFPRDLELAQGALVEPLACGVHMAAIAAEQRGPAVILGAGPVGLMCLQAARQMGFAKTAAVEVNPHRAAVAAQLGAELTVNPRDDDSLPKLQEYCGADGYAVVFDAAGFSVTRQLALRLVRSAGLIVFAGLGEQETSLDCVEIIRREIRLAGSFAYSRSDFQKALDWVAHRRVDLAGWVSEAKLADGQKIFEDLTDPQGTRVKVILRP